MNDHKIRKMKSQTRDATRSRRARRESMERRGRMRFAREMRAQSVDNVYAHQFPLILKEV